jgi:septal ring factor EnvC (AmiA/AmiB activator)
MSSVMKMQSRNFKPGIGWMGWWIFLLSIGAIASFCFLEIKRRLIAEETASTLALTQSFDAALKTPRTAPTARKEQLERLQAELQTLNGEEDSARSACNAKLDEEARLRKTLQQIEDGLKVVPETTHEFAARVARALIVCASDRLSVSGNMKSINAATEPESRLVLVRSVGALRKMEQDLPKFSEFMAEVVAQFYGLPEDAAKQVQKLIHSGFAQMRDSALSSMDRPEQGSDRWEIRSLDWEAARDGQIQLIADSMRSIIPQTHPYLPWLPSVLSMSSGLRGEAKVEDGNASKKAPITVTLPLSPLKN